MESCSARGCPSLNVRPRGLVASAVSPDGYLIAMAPRAKLTRWLDLIAALLRRRSPASFTELAGDVPDYRDCEANPASVMRAFERDKQELRALGIAIDTISGETSDDALYRLKPDAFYLPYLVLSQHAYATTVELRAIARPTGLGYGALPVLAITPDERLLLTRAASRTRALGNPALDADAQSALRKLEFDIGPFPATEPAVATKSAIDAAVFELLRAALTARKRVGFTYRSMQRDETRPRTVEPYGLAFVTGHWYLVARDVDANALRQFRVSRVRSVRITQPARQQADYAIPADFDLQRHAASRQAWELGDGDVTRATVHFRGESGHVLQGIRLGESAPDHAEHRTFAVRRREPFLRWLLTFAGDARPVAPPPLVEEWRTLVLATMRAQHIADASAAATDE